MIKIVRKLNEYPPKNEIVVGKVTNINPNSVFVHLIEYEKDGMVHVSEVSNKWVKDIRRHVKVGQTVTCKVRGIDRSKGHIYLSLKRVSDYERKHALDAWKRERRAEKMLELAAKEKGVSLDDAYDEVGFKLQEEFGEMFQGFKEAKKNRELLEKRGLDKEWVDIIEEIAEKTIEEKETVVKGVLELTCPKSDGVKRIKTVLENSGLDASYISAPKYSIKIKSKDPRSAEQKLKKKADEIIEEIKKEDGEGSFELVKE